MAGFGNCNNGEATVGPGGLDVTIEDSNGHVNIDADDLA
jgi:hypothetical protein